MKEEINKEIAEFHKNDGVTLNEYCQAWYDLVNAMPSVYDIDFPIFKEDKDD